MIKLASNLATAHIHSHVIQPTCRTIGDDDRDESANVSLESADLIRIPASSGQSITFECQDGNRWVCLKMVYTPNEIAIFDWDNDY